MKYYRYYFYFCMRLQKSYFFLTLISEVLLSAVSVIGIILPKFILDSLFCWYDFNKAVIYAALFLISTFTVNLLSAIVGYYSERSRDQMYRKFSLMYAKLIMNGDYQNLENPEYLDVKEKALKCMSGNYGFAGGVLLLSKLIGQLVSFCALLCITMILDVRLLPVFAVLIILSVVADAKTKREITTLDLDSVRNVRMERYFNDISENPAFAKEIRVNRLDEWIIGLYKEKFQKTHDYIMKKNAYSCIGSIFGVISVVLQQAVAYGFLAYKAVESIRGNVQFPIGDFSMYLNAMLAFNVSVTDTLLIVSRIKQMEIYVEPFKRFVEWPQKIEKAKITANDDTKCTEKLHTIRFEHVYFRYPGQDKYAIEDVSCELRSDKKYALVGENGAGKSTFVKLIARLYTPESGSIYFDNRDISEMDPETYRDFLSFVFQDYKLFAMSIRENVELNRSDTVGEEELRNVFEMLGLTEKIERLEAGMDTQVGKIFATNGFEPSGGEAQKIAMARAFLKDAPIVILDEPTASIDPKSESRLYEDFDKLTTGKGCIYISHRMASCRMCDEIKVFSKGRIVEQGNHELLLVGRGLYSEMWNAQAENYI